MEKTLYCVEVMVIGTARVMVEAGDENEARDRAEATATPFHVTAWEYDGDRILSETRAMAGVTDAELPTWA